MNVRITVVFALILGGCAASNNIAPVSAWDKAHMPPQEFTSRLFNQLEARVQQPSSNRTANKPISSYGVWLQPTGTEIPKLCRHDQLYFNLAPVIDGVPGVRTPVQASSVSVQSSFHFLKPPVPADPDFNTADMRRELDRHCADLSSNSFEISASTPRTAWYGMLVIGALREQADKLTDRTKFECLGGPGGCAYLAKGPWYGFGNNCDESVYVACITMRSDGEITIIRFVVHPDTIEFRAIKQELFIEEYPITAPSNDFIN